MEKRLGFVVLLVCALAGPAGAADYNDNDNGNWDVGATWLPAGVPGAGDTATIDSHTVAANIAIDPGIALVDIQAGGTLYFANNQTAELQLNGGILSIGGDNLTTSPVISVSSDSTIDRPLVWSYRGATLAGGRVRFGDGEGNVQAGTMVMRIGGVPRDMELNRAVFTEAIFEAKQQGSSSLTKEKGILLPGCTP